MNPTRECKILDIEGVEIHGKGEEAVAVFIPDKDSTEDAFKLKCTEPSLDHIRLPTTKDPTYCIGFKHPNPVATISGECNADTVIDFVSQFTRNFDLSTSGLFTVPEDHILSSTTPPKVTVRNGTLIVDAAADGFIFSIKEKDVTRFKFLTRNHLVLESTLGSQAFHLRIEDTTDSVRLDAITSFLCGFAKHKCADVYIEAVEAEQTQKIKADAGKPLAAYATPALLEASARVRTYGVAKYPGDPDNWKQVDPLRYRHATVRHFIEWLRDPDSIDEESGLLHEDHIICNFGFMAELREERKRKK